MSAIRAFKLTEVLAQLADPHALIWANGNGELHISPITQPQRHVHEYLIRKGFILDSDNDYIYRPRR